MKCRDRKGNFIPGNDSQDKVIRALYENGIGRGLLKLLTQPFVSKLGGAALSTRTSALAIKSFIENNNIDMSEYEDKKFKSYNEFFIRRIKEGKRPFDMNPDHLGAPADSKLTVYEISDDAIFSIKDTKYSFYQLTRSKKLAEAFKGGQLMVFRLSVDDYHRYSYVDNGVKTKNVTIDGVFHTVNPIAGDILPIYKENQREISLLKSENFGTIMMMEVGALMVGKIVNYHGPCQVSRGQEKGRFEFGGSTVILAFRKGSVKIDDDILENSKLGIETKVRLGEKIGISLK